MFRKGQVHWVGNLLLSRDYAGGLQPPGQRIYWAFGSLLPSLDSSQAEERRCERLCTHKLITDDFIGNCLSSVSLANKIK